VWHGVNLGEPDWSYNSHALAFTLHYPNAGEQLHIMLNAYWEALTFQLPPLQEHERWHRIVDTAIAPPRDFCYPDDSPVVDGTFYPVSPRSSVVLLCQGEL
jgi:isoamylase